MRETLDLWRFYATIMDNPTKLIETASSQEVEPPYRSGTAIAVRIDLVFAVVMACAIGFVGSMVGAPYWLLLLLSFLVGVAAPFVPLDKPSLALGWWGPKVEVDEHEDDGRHAVRGRDIEDVTAEEIGRW